MRLRPFVAGMFLGLVPLAGAAQDQVGLQADQIELYGERLLVAKGNVELRYQGQSLKARGIHYDRVKDELSIQGPIWGMDQKGNIIMADAARLSADLTEGVLTSARLVMNRRLQLAARQIFRVGGRYVQLTDSVASSCNVCTIAPVPLWEIRAKKIVHDQVEQQLYFDQARLMVRGVPVFYLPNLRVPDPTLKRAAGFLRPKLVTTSDLGFGLETPYFIPLGASRDLTLTPFASAKGAYAGGFRYREAFSSGQIEVNGAVARDEIVPGKGRGYLFSSGDFDLDNGFKLHFQTQSVSDPAYLLDYDISDQDRLDSRIEISRTRRNEYILGQFIYIYSIRDDGEGVESNATLPALMGDFVWHRRFSGGPLGGAAGLRMEAYGHSRSSTLPIDTDVDKDIIADGRDMLRFSTRLDWRRNWIFGPGLVGSLWGEGGLDLYGIQQDVDYEGTKTRAVGAFAAELRWPWSGQEQGGASHLVEPVVQFVYGTGNDEDIPNEDSQIVEFDEGNLFSLGRFSGVDAIEDGARLNIGAGWTRFAPSGWSLAMAAGRVYRDKNAGQFSVASGLSGMRSDWLTTAQITLPDGYGATGRMLFNDNWDMHKAELRLDYERERYGLSSSYVWLQADPDENRYTDAQEIYLDGRVGIDSQWAAKMSARYDMEANRANRLGWGVEFKNECVLMDFSFLRRFTSSEDIKPSTHVSFSVDLLGFGGQDQAGASRRCYG